MFSVKEWLVIAIAIIVAGVEAFVLAKVFVICEFDWLPESIKWTRYKYLVRFESCNGQFIDYIYKDEIASYISYIKLRVKYGRDRVERVTLTRKEQINYGLKPNRNFAQNTKVIER